MNRNFDITGTTDRYFVCDHAQVVELYFTEHEGNRFLSTQMGPLYDACGVVFGQNALNITQVTCKLPPVPFGIRAGAILYMRNGVCYLSKKYAESGYGDVFPVKFIGGYSIDCNTKFLVQVKKGHTCPSIAPERFGMSAPNKFLVSVVGAKKEGLYLVTRDCTGRVIADDINFKTSDEYIAVEEVLELYNTFLPERTEPYTNLSNIDSSVCRIRLAGGSGSLIAVIPNIDDLDIKYIDASGNIQIIKDLSEAARDSAEIVESSLIAMVYDRLYDIAIPEVIVPGLFKSAVSEYALTGNDIVDAALEFGVLSAYTYGGLAYMYKPEKVNSAYMNFSPEEIKYIFRHVESFNSAAVSKMKKLLRK